MAPSDFFLYADIEYIFTGVGFNEKVITTTEAYFGINNKSSCKKCLEGFGRVKMILLLLKEIILINKLEFCQEVVVSLVILRTCLDLALLNLTRG